MTVVSGEPAHPSWLAETESHAGTRQTPNGEQHSKDQKCEVVRRLIRSWSYVMQLEEIVIQQTFDDIERSPAGNHRSNQRRPLAVHLGLPATTPQPQHPDKNCQPRASVEDTIGDQVGGQTGPRTGGQQVMPTQQLVQDNAVHECTEADTKKHSGAEDIATAGCIHVDGHTPLRRPSTNQSHSRPTSRSVGCAGLEVTIRLEETLRRPLAP